MRYFVYNPEHGKPKTQHDSFEEAAEEAGRIAIKENKEVYVLAIRAKIYPECKYKIEDWWE